MPANVHRNVFSCDLIYLVYHSRHSYFRCSRYKTMCPGRCVLQDAEMRLTTAHNHPPEPDRVLVDKFRKVLTHRAANESTELYTIYWEEASQRHSEAALLYTFANAESAMRKSRRKQLPQPPQTVGELSDALVNSMLFRVHSGSSRDQFYQTTLTLDDAACVIFIHMKTLSAIGRIEELQLNMALETPANSTNTAYHLFFVHGVHAHQVGCNLISLGKTFSQIVFVFFLLLEHTDCVCFVDSQNRVVFHRYIHLYT